MAKIRFTELVSTHAATGRSAGNWRASGISFSAALVVLSVVSLVLRDGAAPPPTAPSAVVRDAAASLGDVEVAAARLLSLEQIASALRDSRFPAAHARTDAALAGVAEQIRPSLRVDVQPSAGGEASRIAIRWTGDPSTPGAAALVNQLAHDFARIRQADGVAAAQRSRHAAAARVREAANALRTAESDFESVLADSDPLERGQRASEPAATEAITTESADTPPSATSARRAQLQSQLAELESQRSLLAERLMPAHPEMRAIETQIAALRAKLAGSASPETASESLRVPQPVPVRERDSSPVDLTQVRREWRTVLLARREYDSAVNQERSAWQASAQSGTAGPVEILPAALAPPGASEIAWWKIAAAGLPAWLAGWLVLVFWPSPSAPLTTADQVRRATRLPVVIVPSMN